MKKISDNIILESTEMFGIAEYGITPKAKFDVLKKSQQFPSSEVFAKIGVDINDKYKVSENYAKAQEEINRSNRVLSKA